VWHFIAKLSTGLAINIVFNTSCSRCYISFSERGGAMEYRFMTQTYAYDMRRPTFLKGTFTFHMFKPSYSSVLKMVADSLLV